MINAIRTYFNPLPPPVLEPKPFNSKLILLNPMGLRPLIAWENQGGRRGHGEEHVTRHVYTPSSSSVPIWAELNWKEYIQPKKTLSTYGQVGCSHGHDIYKV